MTAERKHREEVARCVFPVTYAVPSHDELSTEVLRWVETGESDSTNIAFDSCDELAEALARRDARIIELQSRPMVVAEELISGALDGALIGSLMSWGKLAELIEQGGSGPDGHQVGAITVDEEGLHIQWVQRD